MVSAAEIRDEAGFKSWLEALPHRTEAEIASAYRWSVILAYRAAMRVLPGYWAESLPGGRQGDVLPCLATLQCALVAGVAGRHPFPEIRIAAIIPLNISTHFAAHRLSSLGYAVIAAQAAARAANAVDTTADASRAAHAAAVAFALVTDPEGTQAAYNDIVKDDAIAASDAFRRGRILLASGPASSPFWQEVSADCVALTSGQPLDRRPLWSEGGAMFTTLWAEIREKVLGQGPEWQFWVDWYDRALTGAAQDWDLLKAVALIPDAVWQAGAEAVAREIEKLRTELALERTGNAERIEVNPETGKLRLVPDSALPDDIADYARRKLARSLDLFVGAPLDQYTGLAPVFRVLRTSLDEAGNLPVELFDACASASRLTVGLGRQGNCPPPEQDALIQDFLTRVREAGADILANDPTTQEVLARRNAITGNNALIEGGAAIIQVANEVAGVSEGRLASGLQEDAVVATDPNADAEERKAASYRLGGRLLRFGKIAVGIVGGTARAIIGTQKVFAAISDILASPLFQQAVASILRWLGF